jgi:hypothetical protein
MAQVGNANYFYFMSRFCGYFAYPHTTAVQSL